MHSIPFRKLTSEGVINWDLLSSGSFSSTFGRNLSSSSAGKAGFSFGLEVSGMMLKRSNLEFYFDKLLNNDAWKRDKLIQVINLQYFYFKAYVWINAFLLTININMPLLIKLVLRLIPLRVACPAISEEIMTNRQR